ncbi:MAG: class I tRNA ligase family protein [Planctomycetota bacterium]
MPFEQPAWLPATKDAVEIERAVLEFWKREGIFEKSLRATEGGERFVFYEGPPTANGKPHPGHVLTRVMKDVFPRYHTMNGRSVPRKAGWDTHGLPVEIEVEKELGLESKDDIEKYGVEPFIKKCVQSVWKYTREWEELTERIGFWVDLGDAYVTYKKEYVQSVWWALSKLWEQGLLYEGHKILPWCPRCGTGLSSHEVGWGYKTVDDPSITIKFRVTKLADGSAPTEPTYLLAWTTTPWTLLSNAALAVAPDADYVAVRHETVTEKEVWILAEKAKMNPFGVELEAEDRAAWTGSVDVRFRKKGRELASALRRDGRLRYARRRNGHRPHRARLRRRRPGRRPGARPPDARPHRPQGADDGRHALRRQVDQGRRQGRDPRPERPQPPREPHDRAPRVPALLAVRHAAPLLSAAGLVHPDDGVPRPDARAQRRYHLVPRAHP